MALPFDRDSERVPTPHLGIAFAASTAPMLLIDPESGGIVAANAAAEEFYGLTADELRSRAIEDLNTLPPDKVREEMARARHGRRSYFEFVHQIGDGSRVPVDVYSNPVVIDNTTYLLSIVHDARDKIAAREETRMLNSIYRATLEAIRGLVTVIDRDYRIVYSNWHDHEHVRDADRRGRPLCYRAYQKRSDPCPWCHLDSVFETGRPQHRIIDTAPDGRIREVFAVPISDPDGTVRYMAEHVRDITGLVSGKRELEQAVREKDALLGEMHHRVKNNLQVVTSLVSLASDQAEDETSARLFTEVQTRIQAMSLVHEALYQTNRFDAVEMEHYLTGLVDDLRSTFGYRDSEATVAVERATLPLRYAVTLGQIANELIANALRHGGMGGAVRRIAVTFRAVDSECVELLVEDNGPGFPERSRPDSGDGGGTLGLTLVGILTEQLRGEWQRGRSPDLGGALVAVRVPVGAA